MLTPRDLSFYGRYGFRRQLPAEILLSIGAQTALLGQFILARVFQPDAADITLLFTLLHTPFLIAPLAEDWTRRRASRGIHTLILIGPAALMMGAFVDGFWGFGPLLILANLFFVSLFVPLRNRLMQANYRSRERGRCFSTFSLCNTAAYFGLAYAGALMLKSEPWHIHWMFPGAGALSVIGVLLFRRIRVRGESAQLARADAPASAKRVYADLIRLLVRDRKFLRFEMGFMLYGAGFMFTMPQEIRATASVLELGFPMIVFGFYGITPMMRMLLVRTFGKLLDRSNPATLSALAFLIFAFYPLTVWGMIAFESLWFWLLARVAFGAAMAGIDITWNIGPVTFGGRERAASYSAAHVFLVGLRASIAPGLGLLIGLAMGSQVFALGALCLVFAALHMRRLGRELDEDDRPPGDEGALREAS